IWFLFEYFLEILNSGFQTIRLAPQRSNASSKQESLSIVWILFESSLNLCRSALCITTDQENFPKSVTTLYIVRSLSEYVLVDLDGFISPVDGRVEVSQYGLAFWLVFVQSCKRLIGLL